MTSAIVTHAGRSAGTPQPDRMGPEDRRGRSDGVAVCAVMGLTWAASALGALDAVVAVPGLIASSGIAAVLIRGARDLRRSARGLPDTAPAGTDLGLARRSFNLVLAAEWVAIGLAINLLPRWDHPQWIPTALCAVVGLHFVPLARLFRVPLYYATGGALCLVATTTIVIGAIGGSETAVQLVPGVGAALSLWATGAKLLSSTR